MKLSTFETVARVLSRNNVRYMVAGGLAVNAHGYLRMSIDIDLALALDAPNIIKAFEALQEIGYLPLVPVTANQFADPVQRQRWIDEKGMHVLNFVSETHKETPIDVFVYEPFDFEEEYEAALQGEIQPGLTVRFVSIPTLISMKEEAGRPKDLDDAHHLRLILNEKPGE